MSDELMENETPKNEQGMEAPESSEETTEQSESAPESNDDIKSALAQKKHFREKFEKAEAERKALEEQLQKLQKRAEGKGLDVEDYIDISSSLDGLDTRQKAFLAEQHRLSGKPLKDIRQSEDFQLWNEAYSARLQKEAALRPNSTQEVEEVNKPFTAQLKNASLAEKEKMLAEAGLWRAPRQKVDRTDIGAKRALY